MSIPDKLISAYFLGTITPEDFATLSAWLQEDPEHVRILARESVLHEGMHYILTGEAIGQERGLSSVEDAGGLSGAEGSPACSTHGSGDKTASSNDRVREIERFAQSQLEGFLRQQHQESPPASIPRPRWSLYEAWEEITSRIQVLFRQTVTLAKVVAVVIAVALVGAITILAILANRPLAVIAESDGAEWRIPKDAEAVLHRGWYSLEAGYARLLMRKGSEVLLQAPCTFKLDSPNRIYLQGGAVCAKVPQRAKGFTVETPTSQIVDYGTEFGAMVGSEHRVEVHVFEGEVGVGSRSLANQAGLQTVSAGEAALVEEGRPVEVHPLSSRTRLFFRSVPDERGLSVPGLRVDLADLVGGGNGYGSGQLGHGIDLNNRRIGPFQVLDRNGRARGYLAMPEMEFIDGIFIPDGGQSGRVTISTSGATLQGCPDTSGRCPGYLINGAIFGAKFQETGKEDLVHFGQLQGQPYGGKANSSIGMHANAGITFDLEALRQSVPNRRITRFTALCGISETAADRFDGYYGDERYRVTVDFWVLVDGQVAFRRTLNAVPSEPVSVDVELSDSSRFLTLMTTDTQGQSSFCWSMFARPELELSKP